MRAPHCLFLAAVLALLCHSGVEVTAGVVPGTCSADLSESPCSGDDRGIQVVGNDVFFSCYEEGFFRCQFSPSTGAVSGTCIALESPCPLYDYGFEVVGNDAYFACGGSGLFQCQFSSSTGAVPGSCSPALSESPCAVVGSEKSDRSFAVVGDDAFFSCGRTFFQCQFSSSTGVVFDTCTELAKPCNVVRGFEVVGNEAFFSCSDAGFFQCQFSSSTGVVSGTCTAFEVALLSASPCPKYDAGFEVVGNDAFFSCYTGGFFQCQFSTDAPTASPTIAPTTETTEAPVTTETPVVTTETLVTGAEASDEDVSGSTTISASFLAFVGAFVVLLA